MKKTKIVRYRLGVSRVFPATHPRKGEETNFDKKIPLTLMRIKSPGLSIKATTQEGEELCPKIHTIRANYPLWERRFGHKPHLYDHPRGGSGYIQGK